MRLLSLLQTWHSSKVFFYIFILFCFANCDDNSGVAARNSSSEKGKAIISVGELDKNNGEKLLLSEKDAADNFYAKYSKTLFPDYVKDLLLKNKPELLYLTENLQIDKPQLRWKITETGKLTPYKWRLLVLHGDTLVSLYDMNLAGEFESGGGDVIPMNWPSRQYRLDLNLEKLNETLTSKFGVKTKVNKDEVGNSVFAHFIFPKPNDYYLLINPDASLEIKRRYWNAVNLEEKGEVDIAGITHLLICIPMDPRNTLNSINFSSAQSLKNLFDENRTLIDRYLRSEPERKQWEIEKQKIINNGKRH